MGPTRKRDLMIAVVGATALGYLLMLLVHRWLPAITVWTGSSLLVVAVVEAFGGRYVRAKISAGEIGDRPGRLHPLAVARSVMIAKASAWMATLVLGWWLGVLAYLLPRRAWLRVASDSTIGAVTAAASALALIIAALWLQYCCTAPGEPGEPGEHGTGT
ncbi:MAG: DUF3180 domain-containing protein [Mycobacteriaceae bacterium]|nr:DUF3180 domain-containing protein [Mycobacteriaceae bacterium]